MDFVNREIGSLHIPGQRGLLPLAREFTPLFLINKFRKKSPCLRAKHAAKWAAIFKSLHSNPMKTTAYEPSSTPVGDLPQGRSPHHRPQRTYSKTYPCPDQEEKQKRKRRPRHHRRILPPHRHETRTDSEVLKMIANKNYK